ncbi:MAG: hydroxyethylthiazole kinase [Clostridia bacterium]|nr:hydroxyethylthiazole kinase [Clostridia bacterium]
MKLYEYLENVKSKNPLVQNITNYVSSNDCANILLACGASPVMTNEIDDSIDIASISDGLVLNIGTLNKLIIKSMIYTGKTANKLNHPIVLDPVGVGISKLRTDSVKFLINNLKISVIRGNISEIKFLENKSEHPKGVDSNNLENLYDISESFKKLSKKLNSIIVATGEIDIITDGNKTCFCKNGNTYMKKVSGTGCQLSSVISAFVSSNSDIFFATISAVCSYGICGEIAFSRMNVLDGNSSYRNYIIDAMCNLNSEIFEKKVNYEIR